MRTSLLTSAAALSLAALSAAQTCFFPNGDTDTDGVPCFSGSGASACCAEQDGCMNSGFCFSERSGTIYRRSCTDANFNDAACASECTTVDAGEPSILESCRYKGDPTGGSWCCRGPWQSGQADYSCCDDDTREVSSGTVSWRPGYITVPNFSIGNTSFSPAGGGGSSNNNVGGTGSTTGTGERVTVTVDSSGNAVTSSARVRTIGLAVGIPLGVLALAGFGGLLFVLLRRGNNHPGSSSGAPSTAAYMPANQQPPVGDPSKGYYQPAMASPPPPNGYQVGTEVPLQQQPQVQQVNRPGY